MRHKCGSTLLSWGWLILSLRPELSYSRGREGRVHRLKGGARAVKSGVQTLKNKNEFITFNIRLATALIHRYILKTLTKRLAVGIRTQKRLVMF